MPPPFLRLISPDEIDTRSPRPLDTSALEAARTIMADIESRGGAAAIEHATRHGDIDGGQATLLHERDSLACAHDRLPQDQQLLLDRVAARIRRFADAQRACIRDLSMQIPGGRAGHTLVPVVSAGCYAPGGRFPLPSSVLMTAITARCAGVERVWVASPRPTDATLAAAHVAGADGLLAIGGAQAIGALAHGLLGVTPCDTIVGPGNRWVTAAKHLIADRVGIDMLAGPSELLVLADDTADSSLVAADLLAQAEHDTDAVPILVTMDAALPARVEAQIEAQIATLPTREIATAALANGFAVVASSINEAIAIADRIGPEHLEIVVRNATGVAERVRHAGAVFIGPASAEVFGDYGAGPNHVLPTGTTARSRAGLSVFTFLRARTWIQMGTSPASASSPRPEFESLIADTAALARLERLEAHARAAEHRSAGRPRHARTP